MPHRTLSSRQFNQDASGAKRAARDGPVFITDRGEPSHVLLTIDDFRRLAKDAPGAIESLSMDADDDIDFEPPRSRELPRPAELD